MFVAISNGPVGFGRKFVLDRLNKMYHYAINHNWPGDDVKNEQEWKAAQPKFRELRLAFGFTGPGRDCNYQNNYAGCSNFVVQPNEDSEMKPCVSF
jgi:hypothetical protein